jgi:hypothetical protein
MALLRRNDIMHFIDVRSCPALAGRNFLVTVNPSLVGTFFFSKKTARADASPEPFQTVKGVALRLRFPKQFAQRFGIAYGRFAVEVFANVGGGLAVGILPSG